MTLNKIKIRTYDQQRENIKNNPQNQRNGSVIHWIVKIQKTPYALVHKLDYIAKNSDRLEFYQK